VISTIRLIAGYAMGLKIDSKKRKGIDKERGLMK
jgi:hypothetical protein